MWEAKTFNRPERVTLVYYEAYFLVRLKVNHKLGNDVTILWTGPIVEKNFTSFVAL